MYAQLVSAEGMEKPRRCPRRSALFKSASTPREDRGEGLDARALPQDPGAPDQPARALRDRRHAARRQLDQPRADA